METPLVSVIVPAYNHQNYVAQCLESISRQTYEKIECIVFDDGSTDDTAKRIREFIANNERECFRLIEKSNEGLCRTLNRGLELSRGEYTCFLASDDQWTPDKIETHVAYLEARPLTGLVFSDAEFLLAGGLSGETWTQYKTIIRELFTDGQSRGNIYEKLMIYTFIPALTVTIRTSAIERIGGFDERLIYEDDDMWLRLAMENEIGFLDRVVGYYRIHETNISNNTIFMLKGYIQTIVKHFGLPELKGKPLRILRIVFMAALNILASRVRRFFVRKGR